MAIIVNHKSKEPACSLMASALQTTSYSLSVAIQRQPLLLQLTGRSKSSGSSRRLSPLQVVAAAATGGGGGGGEGEGSRKRAAPGVDTRIHWDDPDAGWVGGGNNDNDDGNGTKGRKDSARNRFESFSRLLDELSDSHYQFLGVPAEADIEEIKAAYRRLSKEYHPDTTSLPLKTASEKFMRLREIYDVLSDHEKRKFYDWTLAQEAASRQAEKMMLKFEDPYQQDLRNYKPRPDMVDRLDGRNMQLSDQALSALTFDIVVIIISICCIVYVLYFKEQY